MAESYYRNRKHDVFATFNMFIRDLPPSRSFFIFCGLEDVVNYLLSLKFDKDDLKYLASLSIFSSEFLDYLSRFSFTGDVYALPEGTIFFPNEPIIVISAPIIEAQIVESFLLNIVNLQTTIASKAARIVIASKGRKLYDFSLRRTHGSEAAVKVARASYIAGFDGTSNVLAGKIYNIPVVGTMAHSYVMAFKTELESFKAYARTFPERCILLIDTYDVISGAKNAVKIGKMLEKTNNKLLGVRIDSGDIVKLSQKVRKILDIHGLNYVKILASGDLDEYKIEKLLTSGAQVDGFGVGTKMGVSADAPYSDVVYKITEVATTNGKFHPTMKLSSGKLTYPGKKQIYRIRDGNGKFIKDLVCLFEENYSKIGEPLLVKIIERGKLIYELPSIDKIREKVKSELSSLDEKYKSIQETTNRYPVEISDKLLRLSKTLSRRYFKK
jgi:nicotinate phosphoribosyltransferase